jgi:hypothetical protein
VKEEQSEDGSLQRATPYDEASFPPPHARASAFGGFGILVTTKYYRVILGVRKRCPVGSETLLCGKEIYILMLLTRPNPRRNTNSGKEA